MGDTDQQAAAGPSGHRFRRPGLGAVSALAVRPTGLGLAGPPAVLAVAGPADDRACRDPGRRHETGRRQPAGRQDTGRARLCLAGRRPRGARPAPALPGSGAGLDRGDHAGLSVPRLPVRPDLPQPRRGGLQRGAVRSPPRGLGHGWAGIPRLRGADVHGQRRPRLAAAASGRGVRLAAGHDRGGGAGAQPPGAIRGGDADARRGGTAPGQRGTARLRPGAARRARPQHLADQCPGRGGTASDRHAARAGPSRARRDQGCEQGDIARAARHAWRTAAGGRRSAAGSRTEPGPAGRADRSAWRGRTHGSHPDRGHAGAAARPGRPGRVPDRARSTDERVPACRCGPRHSRDHVRGRCAGDPGRQWSRPGRRRRDRGRRRRPADHRRGHRRHARTGRDARRRAVRRATTGWRVPGASPAAIGWCAVIRVLLADDQALVRAGFRALLAAEEGIEVVGEAVDGEEAVSQASALKPDVVLMDIRMPRLDGLEATRRIAADPALAGVRVLILTTFELDEYVFEALRVGASGFLVKDTEPVDLIQGVRVVADGEALLSPSITRRLIEEFAARAKRPPASDLLAPLTEREREVMALVAGGLSNEEIAAKLVVSPATAKTHVSRAMVKLAARDRAQLVVLAYESGLVRPGWLD